MKKLWSYEVRDTKLENFCTWCENSTVHAVHGCEFSHHCSWVRNFRTRVQKFFSFVSLTSDKHNFFVRTSFEVFLDSMESPLSQESRFMPVEDKWGSQPC